jgi:hypothetical protein
MRQLTGDQSVGTMGQWWDDYQTLSNDERERAIADLNRLQQRLQRQRKADDQGSASVAPLMPVIQTTQSTASDHIDTETALDITTKPKRTRTRKPKTATTEQTLNALEAEIHAKASFDQTTTQIEQIQLLPSDDPGMIHANLRAKQRRSPNHRNERNAEGEPERRSIAPRRRQPRSQPLQVQPTIALTMTALTQSETVVE